MAKKIKVGLEDISVYYSPIGDFIEELQELQTRYTSQGYSNLELDKNFDGAITLYGDREENEEEIKKRLERDQLDKEARRRTYENLKKEFEV